MGKKRNIFCDEKKSHKKWKWTKNKCYEAKRTTRETFKTPEKKKTKEREKWKSEHPLNGRDKFLQHFKGNHCERNGIAKHAGQMQTVSTMFYFILFFHINEKTIATKLNGKCTRSMWATSVPYNCIKLPHHLIQSTHAERTLGEVEIGAEPIDTLVRLPNFSYRQNIKWNE